MDPLLALSAALLTATLALVVVVRFYHDKVASLKRQLREAGSSRQSLATTYGRISEQWAPFMAAYPYDPRNFRFLGSPVDGVQFEDDRIVFVEFKANASRLTPREQRMRQLVEEKRVEWLEFRLEHTKEPHEGAPAPVPTDEPPSYWSRE